MQYTQKELEDILTTHLKWVYNEKGGERADLRGAYLGGAYLEGADLWGANLREAHPEGLVPEPLTRSLFRSSHKDLPEVSTKGGLSHPSDT